MQIIIQAMEFLGLLLCHTLHLVLGDQAHLFHARHMTRSDPVTDLTAINLVLKGHFVQLFIS